ncbi:SNF7 family protein isoform X2 [Wolffia australiana]
MNRSPMAVEEAVKCEVSDWDDDVAWAARFKAFSGQRDDWLPRYFFWRDLIVRVARRLGVISFRSSEVKEVWFARGGLTPLCLHHVLIEMHKEGDILLRRDLTEPVRGQIYRIFLKIGRLMIPSTSSPLEQGTDECIILRELLQDKTSDVLKTLSECRWTSSCVITMRKLESICGGSDAAAIILSYLVQCSKAQYFSITKGEFIEGVKVSLVGSSVPSHSTIDYEVLHLIWTMEKMQEQLDTIDRRWELSRKAALVASKSGNKSIALRHIRYTKVLSRDRERYTSLLDRVEEVLGIVSEAIQSGAQAIRKQQISIEQVHLCLQELDEIRASQNEVDETLGLASMECADMEDEWLEEDFNKLQSEVFTEEAPS